MLIGFMAAFENPTDLAKITSIVCKANGLDLIYIRPQDVNIQKSTVNGKMYISGKWQTVETDIPSFIDIAPYCFKKKNKHIMDYLREKSFLSDNRSNVITKKQLQEYLKDDKQFSHLVIPTHQLSDFEDIEQYLEKYLTIVLKPLNGIKGKGVYVLNKSHGKYNLGYRFEEKQLSFKELKHFLEKEINIKKYVLQRHISSRTPHGDPFDCRVHVEKNGKGEWEAARNYIRIGIGQKVISNVNQGGGISNINPFLKSNFGEKWKNIKNNIGELATTLPYRVEDLRNTHIMSLGIDVGINREGELYLFEVNDGPATFAVKSEVALLRTDYYKFVLKNLV